MPLCIVVLVLAFALSAGDKPIPSVDFSDSANGEIEFGKSVDVFGGVHENDVAAVNANEETFLRNFKSLHNKTDLQALASDAEHNTATADLSDGSSDEMESRADTGNRVLRGVHPDVEGLPLLDLPLFTPYQHNKIDTADLSDCARQGEWKPIGVPHGHYADHEDHQQEHFHLDAKGPEAFPSIAVPNTHSPLDAEGLAFWNQFIKDTKGGHNLIKHSKYPKKNQYRPHHIPQNHRVEQLHLSTHSPHHVTQNSAFFQGLRKPADGVNALQLQEEPIPGNDNAHHLPLLPNQPSLSDLEFALLQSNSKDVAQPIHGAAPLAHYKDEDYLSPPPAPHYKPSPPFPSHKTRPLKHSYKPHHRPKSPHPLRGPPPVVERPENHIRAPSFQQQTAADSSTFTCGHNHAQGTNYHTASYQVEGESDPSLLEDEITGSNVLGAPIIVGQPSFEHALNDESYDESQNHRFPKHHSDGAADLEEEGTETGGSDDEVSKEVEKLSPFSQKLVQEVNAVETSTKAENIFETTAPQTFHSEVQLLSQDVKQNRPSKAFQHGEEQQYETQPSFDHSAFAQVGMNSFHSHLHSQEAVGSERFQLKAPASLDHQKSNNQVIVNQEHAVSYSEPNGFFSSQFVAPFSDFSFNSNSPERKPQKNFNPFPLSTPPSSFSDFSLSPSKPNSKAKYQKGKIAVFDHTPFNATKVHSPPKKKRPHKHYEVNENSGEMIPLSALFPPKKMPKQFDMRMPNLAVPKAKRPKPTPPAQPKYQSTVHINKSNLELYQSHPRNKVAKIRLKPKHNRGSQRFSDTDSRRSLTIKSRIQ